MSLRRFRVAAVLPLAMLMLTGFRMPAAEEQAERMLYDVRGAFVTAQPDVSRDLITGTDILVDSAIRATSRSMMLPRTILTVRLSDTRRSPVLFGHRYSAKVTVKVISVGSGEPVAEGEFETSVMNFGKEPADSPLAEKIATRIASEFQLGRPHRAALLTSLASGATP